MNINICSNKRVRFDIQNGLDILNGYAFIISTSYPENIDFTSILDEKQVPYILLIYDDVMEFGNNSFDEALAQDIKDFVDTLTEINTLYVSCDAGESRSGAIGSALMRYFNQDDMVIWKDPHYHPNIFIYNIMCDTLGINISEKELKELQDISDNSLSNTIKSSR